MSLDPPVIEYAHEVYGRVGAQRFNAMLERLDSGKPDIRELMIYDIKHYGYWSYTFTRGDHDARSFENYETWLRALNDADLLSEYNLVREATDNLD